MPQSDDESFHLAITMAGAASAGCYTAGVMDYLFELLDLWEKAKQGRKDELSEKQSLIPQHSVVVEAMGGTSAGGMTATMSAIYALNGDIKPVDIPGQVNEVKNNILYDSWVLMDDDNTKDTRPLFEKIWDTDDLDEGRLGSLLNSKFIDTIADRAFTSKPGAEIKKNTDRLPAYISKDLQLLYSHCFLRGIPLEVNFETTISAKGRKSVIPNHTTYEHYLVTQYHLNQGVKPDTDQYLWLNPFEKPYAEILKLSTKATGAFPLGLMYREFTPEQLGDGYIKTAIKRVITGNFGIANPDPENRIRLKYFPENYSSFTVDGGAINNEPYREVLSILRDKYGPVQADGYHRYGVVMIDPFPDRAQLSASYSKPNDLLDITGNILSTLTDQARIKRREMLDADANGYFKSIIFPRKWNTDDNGKIQGPPGSITCDSAMAFGGFLDISFRQHDFFLGRNNARNFFRYFFSFPYYKDPEDSAKDDIHPIHKNWTPEMVEAFKIDRNGETFLPIIPDLNLLLKKNNTINPYELDIKETPAFDPQKLFSVRKQMTSRFKKILDMIQERGFRKETERAKKEEMERMSQKKRDAYIEQQELLKQRLAVADQWISKEYSSGFLSRTGSLLISPVKGLGIWLAKKKAAKIMTRKATEAILKDLAAKGLLEKPRK